MTRNLLKRLPGGARFRILAVVAAAAGCDSSTGTVPPDHWTQKPPIPSLATLRDERVTAECRTASVTVRARRHIPAPENVRCGENPWIIDLSVESDAGEAMLLDFLRPYALHDWEVHAGGGRVRHDLSVIWDPLASLFAWEASLNGVRPMTIGVCPEGGRGPVVACSEASCELYEREDQVPELFPAWLEFSVRSPLGYEDVQDLHEGDTLDIPMTWTAHRDLGPGALILMSFDRYDDRTHGGRQELLAANQMEFVSPSRYEFGSLRAGESGTVVFRLRARLNDIDEPPVVYRLWREAGLSCEGIPDLQVRVLDRP